MVTLKFAEFLPLYLEGMDKENKQMIPNAKMPSMINKMAGRNRIQLDKTLSPLKRVIPEAVAINNGIPIRLMYI